MILARLPALLLAALTLLSPLGSPAAHAAGPQREPQLNLPADLRGWIVVEDGVPAVIVPPSERPPAAVNCESPRRMPPDAALASDLSLGGIRIKVWPVRSTLPPNYTGCEWELVEATGPGAPADSMNRIGVTVSRDGKPVARLSLVYGLLALRDGFPPLCRYDNGRPVAGSADECRITGWKPEPR